MCGIIGYVGRKQAAPILLDGLKRLEYRGYDSAGVALMEGGEIGMRKCKGRIQSLIDLIKEVPVTGKMGISHTR
ncbi:MAG: glucosamine--fructose-6-phosphate aminotransferase (isomerizing) [Verrucomicrobiales bacterium]|jgi:glucosamine--fructose-6-phosphate aminotransferase (isomerizing)